MAMQIRLGATAAHLEAERKRSASNSAMLNSDLAKPIGILAGTTVGGRRKPRTHQKFSPVLVTRADGSQTVITKTRSTKDARRKVTTHIDIPHRTSAADLPAIFAD